MYVAVAYEWKLSFPSGKICVYTSTYNNSLICDYSILNSDLLNFKTVAMRQRLHEIATRA